MRGEKINWLNILHFYQPPFQDMEIVEKVTEECYLPVSKLLMKGSGVKAVVNINGCLLEMLGTFPEGKKVIANLGTLFSTGKIEITGTGKYHPILPLVSTKEIKIQLLLQEMSLNSFLGIEQAPEVLFLPELAYWPEQSLVFEEEGYKWLIIDEMSLKTGTYDIGKRLLRERGRNINLLVRERDLSESLCNFAWRKYDINTPGEFLKRARERVSREGYIVTASDVEVFGHHQKDRWKLLADIYGSRSINSISIKEIAEQYEVEEVETVPASWSTTRDDIEARIYYPLWHHPHNRLHRQLWQLLDLTAEITRQHGSESQNKKMDTLFSSCPFFWASCMPWWNGIIVENAADHMFELLTEVEGCPEKTLTRAERLRQDVYDEVSMLNRTGRAERLQNEFLANNKVNRKDLYHLIH